IGLRKALDGGVEAVFVAVEVETLAAAGLAVLVKGAHVAARAERPVARPRDDDELHPVVPRPEPKLPMQRQAHLAGERVERPWAVQGDEPGMAATLDQQLVRQAFPPSMRAGVRRRRGAGRLPPC